MHQDPDYVWISIGFADPDPERLKNIPQSSSKNIKKNHDFYCFVTFLYFLSLKNYVNETAKSNTGFGAGTGFETRSVCQRYGSADPDPYQNVTDPQHLLINVYPDPQHLFNNHLRYFVLSGERPDSVPAVGAESDGEHQHGPALPPPHHPGQLCRLVQVHHEHQVSALSPQDRSGEDAAL